MAYDAGSAQMLRDALEPLPVVEKRMFGGIAFMVNGHMACGVHKNGAMFRVGRQAGSTARALPGVGPMVFTGKPMDGYVEISDAALGDDATRAQLIALALAFNKTLAPK